MLRGQGLRRVATAVWVVVVLVALALALAARGEAVGELLIGAEPAGVVGALAWAVAGVGLSCLLWWLLLSGLGARLPLRAALRVFYVGQLGKYLPGSVWPVLASTELGRDHGVARRVSVAAQLLFLWTHLVTAGILAAVGLAVAGALEAWAGAAAAVAGVALLHTGVVTAVLDRFLGLLRRQPLPLRPPHATVLRAAGVAALMWLCYGLSTWLLVGALGGGVTPAVATGAFAAAWAGGFLFVIAPAGAGVREAILVALLPAAADLALAVALTSRLVFTVADGLWGLGGVLLGRAGRDRSAVQAGPDDRPRQRGTDLLE